MKFKKIFKGEVRELIINKWTPNKPQTTFNCFQVDTQLFLS